MKNKILITLISLLIISSIRAQEVLDTTVLKCKYRYTHITNPSNNAGEQDIMILEIGKKICSFYGEANRFFDSTINAGIFDNMFESFRLDISLLPKKNINLDIKLYFNYPTGKITVQDKVFLDSYEYEEDIEKIQWEIFPNDTRELLGYNCKKATCKFRGREYEAWYAPDIPINKGPYKFSGLPGLILRITDKLKQIQFACDDIERISVPMIKNISKIDREPKRIDRKDFFSIQKKHNENQLTAFSAFVNQSKSNITDKNGNTVQMQGITSYNPIELE
jgi:GLPGLI family protein